MIIEERHFNFLQNFIKTESGISLTPDKTYLLESRLSTVARKFNISNVDELITKVMQIEDKKLNEEVIDAVTTNETYFFRDIKPFKFFEENVIKPFAGDNTKNNLRIWCAACSSGQEPYTLSMIINENKSILQGKTVEIVATDINQQILDKAQEGIYNQFEVQRGLPINLLLKYFEQLGDTHNYKIKDDLKKIIKFKKLNLLENYPFGHFDTIFCRNVLIYFDMDTKKAIIKKMSNCLNRSGFLTLGTSETNLDIPGELEQNQEMRSIYLKI